MSTGLSMSHSFWTLLNCIFCEAGHLRRHSVIQVIVVFVFQLNWTICSFLNTFFLSFKRCFQFGVLVSEMFGPEEECGFASSILPQLSRPAILNTSTFSLAINSHHRSFSLAANIFPAEEMSPATEDH